jgi:hypothetical protein
MNVVLQPFVKNGKLYVEDDFGQHSEVSLPFATWFEAVDHLNGMGYGYHKFTKHCEVVTSVQLSDNYEDRLYGVLAEFDTIEAFQAVSRIFEVFLEYPASKVSHFWLLHHHYTSSS